MKMFFFFYIFFSIPSFIFSTEVYEAKMVAANRYQEAKLFDNAIEIYKELLSKPLTPHQRATLQYNIASLLLKKKEWKKGIEELNAIHVDKNLSPFFLYHLYTNLAIAHLHIALKIASAASALPDDNMALYHYRQTATALKEASTAECELQQFVLRDKMCRPSPKLTKLNQFVEGKMASLKTKILKSHLAALSSPLPPAGKSHLKKLLELLSIHLQAMTLKNTLSETEKQNIDERFFYIFSAAASQNVEEQQAFTSAAEWIHKSKEKFSKSEKEFADSNPFHAHLSLLEASQALEEALFWIEPITPIAVLKRIIALQTYAFEISMLLVTDKKDDNALSLAIKSQKRAATKIPLFFSTTYKAQTIKFQKEGLCQASPWGEALPLFEEGTRAARLALEALIEHSIPKTLEFQQEAVAHWKKTFEEILHPSTTKRNLCNTQQGLAEENVSTKNVLSTLEAMEIDDRPPRPTLQPPSETKKPW